MGTPHNGGGHEQRQLVRPRKFGQLYENVIMHQAIADEVSNALDAQPMLACA